MPQAAERVGLLPAGRLAAAVLALAAALLLAAALGSIAGDGRELALAALFGTAFGVVLQRSRFCFFCLSRDFFEQRDARGLLGILTALAVGILGYHLIFSTFLPVPVAHRLPPQAHIGPVSWVLAAGAFSFGLGMALSGSCISAHLYRLGEGSLLAPLALLGALLGFALGFLSWNPLYLGAIQSAPVLWLPHWLGYAGSVALQLLVLGGVAIVLWCSHRTPQGEPGETNHPAPWQRRWPAATGGILVGFIGVLAYMRLGPLGVTAELGSLARTAANNLQWLPARLEGLDTFSGCMTRIKETLWSQNGAFVLALILGALAAALFGGDFKPRKPSTGQALRALLGGVLMGWGAMVALGCTVGTLLSGVMAGAVSGWVFAVFVLGGVWLGLRARRRFGWG